MTADGWALVAAAQAGDSRAFGELWQTYQPQVHRFIRSRVRDRGTAEDLCSDTFLAAWRAIGTVSDQGRDVGAWLITIARNKILDYWKSPARGVVVPATPISAQDTGVVDTELGPEVVVPEQMSRADTARSVSSYVGRLAPRQRDALTMRYVEELPGAEMAARLGCTQSAARMLRTNATKSMRRLLAEDGVTSCADFAAAAGWGGDW
jgi:RNA polymerase sigma-70 factor (ECF subfamily)